MDEKKELTEQEIKQVNGAEWDGHHICGICGAEMTYLRAQPENNSVVYRCPRCGELDAFPY
ncbi:MAG: hypothetical protein IKE16_11795 [Solobacterium sp.]|nr:hypothetical protein [Solobacterium sp.]MBR2795318.1 hypothetical protein [Solobacterium sp.]